MPDPVRFRRMEPADVPAAVEVGRALPAWFTANGIREMSVDLPNSLGFVAEIDGNVVGFVTWFCHMGVAHIGWMAVLEEHHRQDFGRRLLELAEEHVRATGATELRVQTLGDSVEYEPYERTRAFYRAVGFADFKREMTGDPECPEQLTLSKTLR